MDHISGTTPGESPSQAHDSGEPQRPDTGSPPSSQSTAHAGATPGVNDAGPGPGAPDATGATGAAAPGATGAAASGAAGTAAEGAPPGAAAPAEPAQKGAGFRSRGRMRRRARFLRTARELAYRDLGGLVFNLHRFGQRNDALVLAKLNLIGQMDSELRALEAALHERRPITVLREAGVTACARCAAIHSSEDRFCPNCGLAMGRHADLPVGGTQAAAAGTGAGTTGGQPAATQPAPRAGEASAEPPSQPQPEQATPTGPPTQVRRGRPDPLAAVHPARPRSRDPRSRGRPRSLRARTRRLRGAATPPRPPARTPRSCGLRKARERRTAAHARRRHHRPRAGADRARRRACPLCGAPLRPDQDWCLRCGAAARTRLAATPNWRAPAIALALLVALSLGVLAASLVSLAGSSRVLRPRGPSS